MQKNKIVISKSAPLRQVARYFRTLFGKYWVTSDTQRLKDIAREHSEFQRALTSEHRREEFGDLLASLLVFAEEQKIDIGKTLRETAAKINRRAELYLRHGDKKNVAIFGGSFDPPTRGHLEAIKAVLASNVGIDEAWVMPANKSMSGKRLASTQHRVEMCRLLQLEDPRIKFFGYEIDHDLSSETRQTLLRLAREPFADHCRFHFVVGLDVADSIPKWPEADELMRLATFITLPRPGYKLDFRSHWFLQTPHHYLAEAQGLLEVSSTVVREMYQQNRFSDVAEIVPEAVHRYILDNKLYLPEMP